MYECAGLKFMIKFVELTHSALWLNEWTCRSIFRISGAVLLLESGLDLSCNNLLNDIWLLNGDLVKDFYDMVESAGEEFIWHICTVESSFVQSLTMCYTW